MRLNLKLPGVVYVVTAADTVFTRYFSVSTFSPFQCQIIWHDLQLESSKSIEPLLGNSIFIRIYNQLQLNGLKSDR